MPVASVNKGTGPVSEDWFQAALAPMATRPEHGDTSHAVHMLAQHYGIDTEIVPLASEVERTDELRLPDGRRLILKTSARPEAVESFAFQSGTLSDLEAYADVIAPKVLRTRDGALMFRDGRTCGYVQTRLEGAPLHAEEQTPAIARQSGQALGRLNLALARCDPPSTRRPVLWHIGCWTRLSALSCHLPDGPLAEHVRAAMADYLSQVAPRLDALDWQITHNDPSPHNMLETRGGTGFIDFGDGGWNPRLQDLAVAAGHMVTDPELPLGGAEQVLAGYASVIPLSDLDRAVIVGLMRARQAALVLINAWRSHLFPDQAIYINKNVARSQNGLAILSRLDARAEAAAVTAALSQPPQAA
ncbi:Ser/Thr protein kinase RdoA (MazF antagonist) [Sagittula marina]|uniref:Ser/Thr protein kinase RdoA (MazF antagonist) n=2 Tax=Sagittula marina TaxID=943940 RepID=A0A7W6DZQ5_9RHOB|nr:Ser/Thr protein kinase RdoA (MazF antagonist) [Sagittula marina]